MQKYKLPLMLVLILIVPLFIGQLVPMGAKSFLYAISLSMKEILVFVLPLIIFSFLFNSLITMRERAVMFIALLLMIVPVSNFLAISVGYAMSITFLPYLNLNLMVDTSAAMLQPMWKFPLPKLISNEQTIIAGIVVGIYFALFPRPFATTLAKKLNAASTIFLKQIFLPVLPLFVLGFVLKLEHEEVLHRVFHTYGSVLMLIVSTQILYMTLLYFLVSSCSIKRTFTYLRNIFPAALTGFSTISSAATMPLTILCTEKNLKNPAFARVIVPATTNIHTLGSAIGLTILAMSTLIAHGHPLPGHIAFFTFALYYTLAKFGVAGIPGGVLLVVSPLLESYLGFSAEMLGIATAIYLLFDPFGTAINVCGNGCFAIFFNNVYKSSNMIVEGEKVKEVV